MTKQITSRASRVIAAGAFAAALATAGLPAQAASQSSDTETVSVTGGWSNPNMARLAESSGRLLIERIEAAKDMIGSRQFEPAREELDAAQDTAGAIKTMMPFIFVSDSIRNAKNKLLVEDVESVRADLLPIYSQLDEMALYAPQVAKAAKQKVKEAEGKVAKGKTKEAKKSLDEALEGITTTTVYLPVEYVYGQIAIAHAALSGTEPNPGPATRAVDNALKSLYVVVTTLEATPKE